MEKIRYGQFDSAKIGFSVPKIGGKDEKRKTHLGEKKDIFSKIGPTKFIRLIRQKSKEKSKNKMESTVE